MKSARLLISAIEFETAVVLFLMLPLLAFVCLVLTLLTVYYLLLNMMVGPSHVTYPGSFLDMTCHLSIIPEIKTHLPEFHKSLQVFAEEEMRKFDRAVDEVAAKEAVMAATDLKALVGVMTTKFVRYRQLLLEFGELCEEAKVSLQALDDLQEQRLGGQRLASIGQHFAILGVSLDATPEQIKRAFQTKIRLYHPDKQQGQRRSQLNMEDVEATRVTRQLTEAKEKLADRKAVNDFHASLSGLFAGRLKSMQGAAHSEVECMLSEQRYVPLKKFIASLSEIDAHAAQAFGLDASRMHADALRAVEAEVGRLKVSIRQLWDQRSLKELNLEWSKVEGLAASGLGGEGLTKTIQEQIEAGPMFHLRKSPETSSWAHVTPFLGL